MVNRTQAHTGDHSLQATSHKFLQSEPLTVGDDRDNRSLRLLGVASCAVRSDRHILHGEVRDGHDRGLWGIHGEVDLRRLIRRKRAGLCLEIEK